MHSEIADEVSAYEQSVLNMRHDPAAQDFVKAEFLDENLDAAIARFPNSEDFKTILGMIESIDPDRSLSILDLGGGRGILSFALAERGYCVTMLEINRSAVCGQGALCGRRLTFAGVCGDFNALPFKAGAFDIVICKQTLHHSEHLARVLSEVVRVLKKGGCLVAYKEHCLPIHGGKRIFLKQHLGVKYGARENAFRTVTYLASMRRQGFRKIKITNLQSMAQLHADYKMDRIRARVIGLPLLGTLLLWILYYKYFVMSILLCRPGQTMNFIARKG